MTNLGLSGGLDAHVNVQTDQASLSGGALDGAAGASEGSASFSSAFEGLVGVVGDLLVQIGGGLTAMLGFG